jgi:hypothetical protein
LIEQRLDSLELLLSEDVLGRAREGHLCLFQLKQALLADRDIGSDSGELHLGVNMATLDVIDHLKERADLGSIDFVHP